MTAPAVLLLDEPTSALDVSVQAEVLNLLARAAARAELTMVLVSHNLAVVAHLCSVVGVMQAGRLVETVMTDELRRRSCRHTRTPSLLRALTIN